MFGIHARNPCFNIIKDQQRNQLVADVNIMLAYLLLVLTVLSALLLAAGNIATVSGGAMPV